MRMLDYSDRFSGYPFVWDILPLDTSSFLISFDVGAMLVTSGGAYTIPLLYGPKRFEVDGKGGVLGMYSYRLIHYTAQDIRDWEALDLDWDKRTNSFHGEYYEKRSIGDFRGSAIRRIREDLFLLAGIDGLYLLRGKEFSRIPEPLCPIKVRTTEILATDTAFWISTLGQGAFHWDGESFFQLGTQNGLLDPHCTAIFEDSGNNIWIGTPRGVHLIPSGYRTPMRYFSARNGLPSDEITGIGQSGDSLWIGTTKGLCRLDLQNLEAFLDPPKLSVSSLERNGSPVNPRRPPSVSSEDHLDIHIAAISFRNQGRVLYRYWLEKDQLTRMDSGETYQGNLSFHGLPSGSYELKVQASNGGQEWGSPETMLSFQVATASGSVSWLFLGGLVAILLIVGGLIRYTRRQGEKEVEEAPEHRVTLRVDGMVRVIRTSEIYYVKASGDFVEVFLEKEKVLYRSTMKGMEAMFADYPMVVRVHRSYLVNLFWVRSFSGKELDLQGQMVPLSKSYRPKVIPLLENHVHSS